LDFWQLGNSLLCRAKSIEVSSSRMALNEHDG
jgi:hypothetical protein